MSPRTTPRAARGRLALLALLPLLAVGCRESKQINPAVAFVPSSQASAGCTGPDQAFTPCDPMAGPCPPLTDVSTGALPILLAILYPSSQVAASGNSDCLYVTGSGGTLLEIDFSGAMPVETEILTQGGGAVAALLGAFGIMSAPQLSGVTVLDGGTVLVMDMTSNAILAVNRTGTDMVTLFAGDPSEIGTLNNGLALGPGGARFDFERPSQMAPLGDGRVLIADPGNNAIREYEPNAQGSGVAVVGTLSGNPAAFHLDGDISIARYDTPNGLSVTCQGQLVITESGEVGLGGNRLRQVVLGVFTPSGVTGVVFTRAGDGTDATVEGDGPLAELAMPVSPVVTTGSDIYWLDSTGGILRRMTGANDTVDCPLWVDCAAAVAQGGNFSDFADGGALSMAQTRSGFLYVLDTFQAVLFQVSP